MKKRIFFMLPVFVFLFAPGLGRAAEEEPHPEITLIDYDGNEISLESNIPYSPKNTCSIHFLRLMKTPALSLMPLN
ncbi:MAG: hypothetical protein PVG08_08610 [Desulfobacterales bacterium]|jgi:hypothetical protein